MQWSLSLQCWTWCLRCCSVVVSSKGTHKVEQNYKHPHKKNPTNCPKFKCNTVSVKFSACRCNSVVLSSKVGRKREKKNSLETVLRMESAAVACLPAAVSLLLLEVLFMQISGVSLALTWPCRLCLLRFLLCGSLCYRLSPFQALGKVTLHPCCQACVFIYSSCGRWVFPPLLWSFPPTSDFTSFLAPDYWVVLLLLPAAMFVYSSHGKWVFPPLLWSFPPSATLTSFPTPGCWARDPAPARGSLARLACLFIVLRRIPFSQSSALSVPHPLSHVSLLLLLITQFLFFPGWRSVCPRGYAALAQAWLWEYRGTVKLTWSSSSQAVWAPATGGPGALLVSPFNVKWRFSAWAGGVEGSNLCLFSVIMPAKCVSSVSPRFRYRRLTFCFLPLATILESVSEGNILSLFRRWGLGPEADMQVTVTKENKKNVKTNIQAIYSEWFPKICFINKLGHLHPQI
jgi:hypothetical protein